MTDSKDEAYGIVFVGPPGEFSVWRRTPDGRLMDRESAEFIGQTAALAGAADYRVFPLDPAELDGSERITAAECDAYRPELIQAGGVPKPAP